MLIKEHVNSYEHIFFLEGKLDANGSGELETALRKIAPIIKEVQIDLGGVDYISSMGLRVILNAYKTLAKYKKKLRVVHISDSVSKVFQMSGFIDTFIRDEKFVIVEKESTSSTIGFNLIGSLDDPRAVYESIKNKMINMPSVSMIYLHCDELRAISKESCEMLAALNTQLRTRKIHLIMDNAAKVIVDSFNANGKEAFVREVIFERS